MPNKVVTGSMKPSKINPEISRVPTNVITGFLGVGKTSAILHLLKRKPDTERWAVLVNEFGEIGVDGSLFQGQHGEQEGVFVREVPGGCMCCAAGLPMQVALNQLLAHARPDRLLIEPTGLGHPAEVLAVLSGKHNRDVLSLQSVVTLVDARKLKDRRYTEHETFNQQIAIADLIVGNKQDLYQAEDEVALECYARERGKPGVKVQFSRHGALDFSWLAGPSNTQITTHHHTSHNHDIHSHHIHNHNLEEVAIPESGMVSAVNSGEGFNSIGWRFSDKRVFDYNKLYVFLTGLVVERMKAVFITNEGCFGFNLTSDNLTQYDLNDGTESRMEIISGSVDPRWEPQLLDCLIPVE